MDKITIDTTATYTDVNLKLNMEHKIYVDPESVEFEEHEDHLHVILSPKHSMGNAKMRLILNKDAMKEIVLKILE